MKRRLFIICMLFSAVCAAQSPDFGFSLTAGSDFHRVLPHLGLEYGIYSANRAHSILATVQADWIDNADLPAYGRADLVHPDVSTGISSHAVGLKYVRRLSAIGPVSIGAVIHPWYSFGLDRMSGHVGGRFTFTHKGDIVGAELVNDPFIGRYTLRLVFTAIFKKGGK